MQTVHLLSDLESHVITLPNGENVDVIEDLACCGTSAGFNYEEATLGECADFLADWYGGPDEHLQELISRDALAFLILSAFLDAIPEENLKKAG